ncbi:hypothetical protein B4U79_11165 [Dinothrombium tinctorium]|uniref:Uncharacterized protein n=1 Tax=Dinothrombium tinctorium TaxID=1965070 RepID=A0A3S3Q5H1_9ACAR|nr:hypothetical protein B4U79_09296 [Dinothrombium tinctorium]RWS13321.1 hypothetical protein B4U79_00215 [Dinothrombium tinctorium]RWS14307.1 hypothetical protein B4U79_01623 [Dinothrombium tinctorium]RWS14321.1 hypothetical protein B4U79_11165 [Dinothrombium tinctorium]
MAISFDGRRLRYNRDRCVMLHFSMSNTAYKARNRSRFQATKNNETISQAFEQTTCG